MSASSRFSIVRLGAAGGVLLVCLLAAGGAGCRHQPARGVATASSAVSERETTVFYRSGRPYARWWWFATEVKKEEISADLDWLKQKGFGGVEIAWIYEEKAARQPPAQWLSPEWSELVVYAKQYAEKIGLGCDFTFGSAWPFGDRQVAVEDAETSYSPRLWPIEMHWENYGKVVPAVAMDHLSRRAFDQYADRMGRALGPALQGARSGLFCDSLELVSAPPLWTDGFDHEFEGRFHYDIKPLMGDLGQPKNNDARYDYLKLVSAYMLDNFFRPFSEKAHQLGAFSRVQVAGAPVDMISAYALADVPESEAMLYAPSYAQIAASAGALAGRRDVSAETFTCAYGFPDGFKKQEQTADLKLVADAVFANGVNHIVWHGKPLNVLDKTPGAEFFASVHVGESGNLSPELPAFNAYMEKVSNELKRGRVYSSVAVYLPTEDAWMNPDDVPLPPGVRAPKRAYVMRQASLPEEVKGWRPLWVNADFLKRGSLEGGRLRIGELGFSALYLDVDYLEGEALDTVLRLARGGLSVCLKKPPHQPGRQKSPTFEGRVRELQALPNVSSEFARVDRELPLVSGDNLPDFWARVDGDETIVFFANPKTGSLHGALQPGQSLATGDAERPVRITAGGKTTPTVLVFKPYQSILVIIDARGTLTNVDITFQPRVPKVRGGP